jgi:hypothetical protein
MIGLLLLGIDPFGVCHRRFIWKIGLNRLEKAGAFIGSTEMILYDLLKRADTPEFRNALSVLKRL